jgi:hypothetical protein
MMRRLTIADYTLFPHFGRPALAVRWRSCHHEGPFWFTGFAPDGQWAAHPAADFGTVVKAGSEKFGEFR